jgi:hypothetical protein
LLLQAAPVRIDAQQAGPVLKVAPMRDRVLQTSLAQHMAPVHGVLQKTPAQDPVEQNEHDKDIVVQVYDLTNFSCMISISSVFYCFYDNSLNFNFNLDPD